MFIYRLPSLPHKSKSKFGHESNILRKHCGPFYYNIQIVNPFDDNAREIIVVILLLLPLLNHLKQELKIAKIISIHKRENWVIWIIDYSLYYLDSAKSLKNLYTVEFMIFVWIIICFNLNSMASGHHTHQPCISKYHR